MNKTSLKTIFFKCFVTGIILITPIYFSLGKAIDYPWYLAVACLGACLAWTMLWSLIWIVIERKKRISPYDNPLAQKMRQFEAYYSKKHAWIFFCLAVVMLIVAAVLPMLWFEGISMIVDFVCLIISLTMFGVFAVVIKKDGIAVEVIDEQLILHKKELIKIALVDIVKISIHDYGSFDIAVRTATQRYGMHCFIKEQRKKKDQLIALLKSKGIKVETFSSDGV